MTITDVSQLRPGDVVFSTISGRVGWWVNLGQALLRDSCRWTHARIVVDGGMWVEAMPTGARIRPVDLLSGPLAIARLPLTTPQRYELDRVARDLIGTPYGFSDYLALAAWEWNLPGRQALRRYVSSSGRMICSQLVDHALCEAGFHLFDDGRLPQDVTPGDLFYATERLGWTL